jgi:hypothetical protein
MDSVVERDKAMARVRLVLWNEAEAASRAAQIEKAGHELEAVITKGGESLRGLRESKPDAVLIDLSRLPSHGRAVALMVRKTKATRHIPLVLLGGDPAKVAAIRARLPDAVYTGWSSIGKTLKKALATPPANPVVPDVSIATHAPLARKLGIRTGSTVAAIDAPRDFLKVLGDLPDGVQFTEQPPADVIIRFASSCVELQHDIRSLALHAPVWVAWPKQSARRNTDLTQNAVREIGFSAGLVDYKICSIDKTWSGMLFSRRKQK